MLLSLKDNTHTKAPFAGHDFNQKKEESFVAFWLFIHTTTEVCVPEDALSRNIIQSTILENGTRCIIV